ncbi:hypothetical protein C8R42DRAFT_644596 [Lentinula raphanica]|nr:hypothetical protein C8R42DRAFT_644596 [Lentinula raphanica]
MTCAYRYLDLRVTKPAESHEDMTSRLNLCKAKQPLFEVCESLGVKVPKKSNLEKLRNTLLDFWGDDILAYDEDDMNDGGAEEWDLEDDGHYDAYQQKLHIDATQVAEGNRRSGGRKTQAALVKLIEAFLLQFIDHNAIRPKHSRRGAKIMGSYLGASQQKKLFFAALRIRKEQEAVDPTLRIKRPATSVTVWDLLKSHMDMALHCARSGLVPVQSTVQHQEKYLQPKELRDTPQKLRLPRLPKDSQRFPKIFKATQHASGNCSDNVHALKLAELQPHTLFHPNKETAIFAMLELQGEEKAGKQGLRMVINPTYTTFIAHLHPESHQEDGHQLVLEQELARHLSPSWFEISHYTILRTEHVQLSRYIFLDTALGTIKKPWGTVHQPFCIYSVDPNQTLKLGWARGSTYHDVYAPAIPVTAVLGGAGYKVHETYDPPWRHVHVPERFLLLVCPMAETIHDSVVGKKNLSRAANFWNLVMDLRLYVFQCGAAIYQHPVTKSQMTISYRLPLDSSSALLPAANIVPTTSHIPTTTTALPAEHNTDDMDIYQLEDESYRPFVDLKLPPVDVYTKPGGPIFLLPPYVGQKSIIWDDVFKQVQQPEQLWDLYKPTKTLDQWESLSELWHC